MATWVVVNQRQTVAKDATGAYAPVMAVTFRLASGTTATINVPVAEYTADAVTTAINSYAAALSAVDGLAGGS
jgi:hypothetical protein